MLRNDNQFAASASRFSEYLQVADAASRADPVDTQWIDHRMLAHRFVADSALALGHVAEASRHYRAGLALAQQLADIETGNKNWQIEYALFELRLAQMKIRDGQLNDALQAIESSRARVREYLTGSTDSMDWLTVGTYLDLETGNVLMKQGDFGGAALIASSVIDASRQIVAADPTIASTKALLVNGLILAARTADRDSELLRKHPALLEALAVFREIDTQRLTPDDRDTFIRASLYAGFVDDVTEDIELLRQAGYRHPDFVAELHTHGIDY
jgi:tetratricopeptide (TPR) repeat protein